MPASTKVGLNALLTPENCVLLLIDHQPFQLANVNSHEPTMVINNVTALARTAKVYGIPTILTTVNAERGGAIFKQVQAVFPDQKPIDRTFINSWEEHLGEVAQIFIDHGGATGSAFLWEMQLLHASQGKAA